MEDFKKTFRRMAVKYIEYVEDKIEAAKQEKTYVGCADDEATVLAHEVSVAGTLATIAIEMEKHEL